MQFSKKTLSLKDYYKQLNMKRVLVIFAAMALALCSCSPLYIVMDKNKKGERSIMTSTQRLCSYRDGVIKTALGCRIQGKDTVLAILITSDADKGHCVFENGDKLMFRLKDGKEIHLSNILDKKAYESETRIETTTTRVYDYGYAYSYSPWTGDVYLAPYEIGRMVPRTYTVKETASYALYLVSLQQILDICTKDVVKVRVELEDQDLDITDASNVSDLYTRILTCLGERARAQFQREEF